MILANYGVVSSSGASFDADALAFMTAAAITDNTQKTAVNTLVTDLKAYNIWTKMKALYPFVGGSATSHKYNLKDPRDLDAAYRLTFNGGWTHSSTGALPNGTTAYADTFFTPSVDGVQDSSHMMYISRTAAAASTSVEIGSLSPTSFHHMHLRYTSDIMYALINTSLGTSFNVSGLNTNASYIASRSNSSEIKTYRNGSLLNTNTSPSVFPNNRKIYLAALNNDGATSNYSIKESIGASVGTGLTDTDALNIHNLFNTFNTTLSRNI